MTVAITQVGRGQAYIPKLFEIDITSYTTGGEIIGASALGLSQIDHIVCMPNENGYIPVWDKTNGKMKIMNPRPAVTGTLSASVNSGATAVLSSAANGAIITLTGNPAVAAAAGAEAVSATDCGTFVLVVFGFPN